MSALCPSGCRGVVVPLAEVECVLRPYGGLGSKGRKGEVRSAEEEKKKKKKEREGWVGERGKTCKRVNV